MTTFIVHFKKTAEPFRESDTKCFEDLSSLCKSYVRNCGNPELATPVPQFNENDRFNADMSFDASLSQIKDLIDLFLGRTEVRGWRKVDAEEVYKLMKEYGVYVDTMEIYG